MLVAATAPTYTAPLIATPNAPPSDEAILIPEATPTLSNGAFEIAVSVEGVA